MSKIILEETSKEQKEQGDPKNSVEVNLNVKLLKILTDFASSSDSNNGEYYFALNLFFL